MRRLNDRLSRLEQAHLTRHVFHDTQLRRIAESIAIGELLHRTPPRAPAERLAAARAALQGPGDPDRVVRQWLTCHRLAP